MGAIESANIYGLTIRESATDGSDFTNPAADYRRLFLGEDGLLHLRDSAGTVTDIGGAAGSVATDAIWDAAGDLAVGTGANTAARVAIGATRTLLKSNGTTAAWALPTAIGCIISEATAQSMNDATDTALTSNDAEILDTDAFHDTSSNTSRITVPSGLDGKYLVQGTAYFAADGDGYRHAFFKVGGVTTERGYMRVLSAGAGAGTYVSASVVLVLAATNYVELFAGHTAGNALNVNMASFSAMFLGI